MTKSTFASLTMNKNDWCTTDALSKRVVPILLMRCVSAVMCNKLIKVSSFMSFKSQLSLHHDRFAMHAKFARAKTPSLHWNPFIFNICPVCVLLCVQRVHSLCTSPYVHNKSVKHKRSANLKWYLDCLMTKCILWQYVFTNKKHELHLKGYNPIIDIETLIYNALW